MLTEAYLPRGAAPKRSLGQNFLVDGGIARRMVDAMALAGDEVVVEIGGGRGAMTGLLAERSGRLLVVEIDRALAAGLAERFGARAGGGAGSGGRLPGGARAIHDDSAGAIEVITGDILDIDPAARLGLRPGEKAVVFGNIPYYASSPILIWLAENASSFRRAYLTMQREVAERLTASPGEKAYGSITVRLAYAAASRRLFSIPPDAFRPRPKVVSSFVELAFHERPPVDVADEALLFRVVRAAFAQRRKTLRNTLALLPEVSADAADAKRRVESASDAPRPAPARHAFTSGAGRLDDLAAASGIDLGRRGETLSLAEFARLATAIAEARCRG